MGIGDAFKKIGQGVKNRFTKRPSEEEQAQPSTYWESRPSHGGEGSIPIKWILIFVGIIAIGVGFFALLAFTPVGTMLRAPGFQMQYSFGNFFSSFGIRKMIYDLTHPFEVQTTEAQTEKPNKNEYLNKIAESMSIKGDVIPNKVEVKTKTGGGVPFTVYLNIVNEGTDSINKFWVALVPKMDDDYSRESLGPGIENANIEVGQVKEINHGLVHSCEPIDICTGTCDSIGFPLNDPDICNKHFWNDDSGSYIKNKFALVEYDAPLPAGGSVTIPFSEIYIEENGNDFSKASVAIPFFARIYSFYIAASRLPVTFIDNNYATLLYSMNKYRYSEVPATAMAGTAMKINLDIGQQPISSTTKRGTILISFENKGRGKLYGSPILILLLPKDTFGNCKEYYYLCDDEIKGSVYDNLCKQDGIFYSSIGGFANKELKWICDSINDRNRDFHICITNPTKELKEFQTYACTVDITAQMHGSKRQTTYVTAFAVYPYMYEVPLMVTGYEVSNE